MKALKSLIGNLTILVVLAVQVQAQSFLTNGLVAYYPFNGNANDASGNGNNGTVIGAVIPGTNWLGEANMAYSFNDTGYINVPDNQAFHLQAMTISSWLNLETNSAVDIIDKDDNGQGFQFFTAGYVFGFGIGDGSWHNVSSTNSLSAGAWHQLVATYDQHTISLFVDGINTGSMPYTTTLTYAGNSLQIGRDGYYDSEYITGSLGSIRVYNRALAPSEVTELFSYEAATNSVTTQPVINILRAVVPSFSNLVISSNYQLQASSDMSSWTNQGLPFTATNTSMVYPQYWNVANWNQLFFRLQLAP